MTLPQNMKDAVDYIDASGFKGAPIYESSWQTIRAHIMSQEAEIERLQSRLAAADALMSRCFVQIGELTKGLDPHDPIYVELQQLGLDWMQHSAADTAHLSENTHDHS